MITGATVLALKYKDGVMMFADTLGSYGSMARFTDLQRIKKVNETTAVGASGEWSDFEYITKMMEEINIMDFEESDGRTMTPKEYHCWLSRVLYNRRTKVNPLWNQCVTMGYEDGKSFLGYTDLYGSAFEDDLVATGFGAHLGLPLLRKQWRADMSYQQAKDLIESAMTVCFYRDCRAINKYRLSTATKEGVTVSEPYTLKTFWEFKLFKDPYGQ